MKNKKILGILASAFMLAACAGGSDGQLEGKKWLEERGYTQVSGGGSASLINACGQNVFSRKYDVVTPEGEHKTQKVCFGPLGKHKPLF